MRWSSGDGVTIDVLAPPRPFLAETGDDVNENSIVALLRYRRADGREFRALFTGRRRLQPSVSKLFTGDAGTQTEERVLAAETDIEADVPHFTV